MELKGKLLEIFESQTYGKTEVREVLLETQEQYPQKLKISFLNDKIHLLNNYKKDKNVIIKINLRGKEYNGKYYTNINGWDISENLGEVTNNDQNPERIIEDLLDF